MDELPNELLSFIFDFVPEDSLELRKVCDDWDFVITKYYNRVPIEYLGTFKEIIEIFYRSKLNVIGYIFIDYARYIYKIDVSAIGVKDVSSLGNVHTLILRSTDVEDVSFLSNVYALDLGRSGVEDVSSLGNVDILNISWTRVKDVSSLGYVHTLYLYGVSTDISMLKNVNIYR